MAKDCRFEFEYNIFKIHDQQEIINEDTPKKTKQKTPPKTQTNKQKTKQKPRSLIHLTTQIYYQQENDDKLPVYIIYVN